MLVSDYFENIGIGEDLEFNSFGNIDSNIEGTLSYLCDAKYIARLNQNKNIVGVITTKSLALGINDNISCIIDPDPVSLFYSTFINHVEDKILEKSNISPKALISNSAIISNYGVIIDDNVVIEDFVVIKSGVTIKKDCIIRAGTIIGGDGFEVKTIYGHQRIIPHDGYVILGNNVDIGYNTCIDKGMFGRDTIVGNNCKIKNLCQIAHGAQISDNTKIAAQVLVGGCTIGKNVWIGPGSTILNGIIVGDNVKIRVGSVVVQSIDDNGDVSGNFAYDHMQRSRGFVKEKRT